MEQQQFLSPGQAGRDLKPDWVARRLAGQPHAHAPCAPDPHDDIAGYADIDPDGPLVEAAVLVPLVDRADGLSVLLTERAAHLGSHAGQISFPGGRIEPHDATPAAAALRETHEEVGIDATAIDLVARLGSYVTGTGYRIVPVVGLVRTPLTLRPDPGEVASVFEVPLSFILESRNHQRVSRMRGGRRRRYYTIGYGDRVIWGATAAILVGLSRILSEHDGDAP